MLTKPDSCKPCPMYHKGAGFCLGWGNPKTAMLALNLETPANNEISHLLDPRDKMDNEEITRRLNAFPNLERKHVNKGIPIVGRSGWLVDQWILRAAGIRRHELFLDNTLRCFPPKGKNDSHYPIGEERKEAEQICRQYDRWEEFSPDIAVISMHPASLLRDPSPLSLIVEDFKKMRDFTKQGLKVIGLLGGKSAKQFLKYGETVTRFRGHYSFLPKKVYNTRYERNRTTREGCGENAAVEEKKPKKSQGTFPSMLLEKQGKGSPPTSKVQKEEPDDNTRVRQKDVSLHPASSSRSPRAGLQKKNES